jgi:hypothetical protein
MSQRIPAEKGMWSGMRETSAPQEEARLETNVSLQLNLTCHELTLGMSKVSVGHIAFGALIVYAVEQVEELAAQLEGAGVSQEVQRELALERCINLRVSRPLIGIASQVALGAEGWRGELAGLE